MVEQPAPLSTDADRLEMGDLIVGYSNSTKNKKMPFHVPPEAVIPQGQDLMFHFETYHLQPGPDGVAEFQVVYELKKRRQFCAKIVSKRPAAGTPDP